MEDGEEGENARKKAWAFVVAIGWLWAEDGPQDRRADQTLSSPHLEVRDNLRVDASWCAGWEALWSRSAAQVRNRVNTTSFLDGLGGATHAHANVKALTRRASFLG